MEISKEQYEYALNRIEELLPLVTDETPAHGKNALELAIVSDVVEEYEKIHYPIAKPTIGDLISLSIEERGMTQKQLASEIGVSPSRVNDHGIRHKRRIYSRSMTAPAEGTLREKAPRQQLARRSAAARAGLPVGVLGNSSTWMYAFGL